jgi:hypothetical protein
LEGVPFFWKAKQKNNESDTEAWGLEMVSKLRGAPKYFHFSVSGELIILSEDFFLLMIKGFF